MSVALTEQAVRARRKTVTRRLGWTNLKPGDRLTLCRKVMGRRRPEGKVEPLIRIAEVAVISVRRERLDAITTDDVIAEGLPHLTVRGFVRLFCQHMRCHPHTEVTRIEWRYLSSTGPADQTQPPDQSDQAAGTDDPDDLGMEITR